MEGNVDGGRGATGADSLCDSFDRCTAGLGSITWMVDHVSKPEAEDVEGTGGCKGYLWHSHEGIRRSRRFPHWSCWPSGRPSWCCFACVAPQGPIHGHAVDGRLSSRWAQPPS